MPSFLIDDLNFTAGNPLSGHTPNTGLAWTALTGGDAINWGGTKIGELNALPNISGFTCNPTVPPQADYNARVNFLAGNNVFGMNSLGLMIRLQQTVFAGFLDFYYLYYAYQGFWILAKINQSGGGPGTFGGSFAMALNAGQTYVVDMGVVGSTVTVSVDGVQIFNATDTNPFGLTAAGHVGVLVSNQTPAFTSADGWWFDSLEGYYGTPTNVANFGLYFAGSGIEAGQDFTTVDYGAPTPVSIDSPATGYEYAINALPVDLAGFLSGRMGSVKLRRSGVQSTTNVVFRGATLRYKKIQT